MKAITENQYRSLTQAIYEKLMENPEMGMGEMGECKEVAEMIVDEWMQKEGITFEKSEAASKVLKMMDADYSYFAALETVLGEDKTLDKEELEAELNRYC